MDQNTRGKWTTAEIVYVSISGVLICMAFAEIIAFTGSLSYSFVKVHQKAKAAGQRGVQYLSLVVMLVFWVLRILFLGAMLSLVPVPHWQGMSSDPLENHQFIPSAIIVGSQYFAFFLVFLLLVMPTVISIHQLATCPTNIKEQLDSIRTTSTFPRVLIVMPVYNELPEVLHIAICSAIDGDYPKEHLHIFISFDNDAISDLYRALIRNLGLPADGEWYPPVLDLYFRGVQITVSRFPHGGKRLTQKKTFGLINSIYKEYPDKTDHLFVLFIDSDILLHPSTIANFVWDMQFRPNHSNDLLAMTGVITVTTKTDMTFINLLQDIEYVHGQFIGRAIESAVGGCVTLPGALTIFRYSAFLKSYDEYFAERTVSDLWDFGRSHLGEDRYLTHLLMAKACRPKMIQFCHRATCKTEPVREWRNLMKQRRRWFLGFLTNEGAFLSDPHLWAKYPWLVAFRLIQDIVNGTSMVSYVTIVAIATGMEQWSLIWLSLLAAYFFLNWGLMFTYGVWLGRFKALLYPMMFIVGPFVTWFLLVYGVITANERTWGGPRADAAAVKTTPQEASDQAGEHEKEEERDGSEYPQDEVDQYQDSYSDEDRIELPDHLFYPDQQQLPASKTRRKKAFRASTGNMADRDIYGFDPHSDELDADVCENSRRTTSKSKGMFEMTIDCDEFVMSLEEEESDDSGDEMLEEAPEDENNLDSLEQSCGEYYSSRPLGSASSPLPAEDTQWWDNDKHLSMLGILPYLQQPKIPAMFASVETLILTPVIPSTAVSEALPSSSVKSFFPRSSSSSSLYGLGCESLGHSTASSTQTPGSVKTVPKPKSVHGTQKPRSSASSIIRHPDNKSGSSPMVRRSTSSPNFENQLSRSAVPGSESSRGKQVAEIALSSPALSIARRRKSTTNLPSPQSSFQYIPAEYFTPSNSTPTTPKLSPLVLPNRGKQVDEITLSSPALSTARRRKSTTNLPSPQSSFQYIPAEYFTPSNSTPTTPKLSPLVLPSPHPSKSRNVSSSSVSSTHLPSPSPSLRSSYFSRSRNVSSSSVSSMPLPSPSLPSSYFSRSRNVSSSSLSSSPLPPPSLSRSSTCSCGSRAYPVQESDKVPSDILAATAAVFPATAGTPNATAASSSRSKRRRRSSGSPSRTKAIQKTFPVPPVPAIPSLPQI